MGRRRQRQQGRRTPPPAASLVVLGRGLVGACPRCGGRGLFTSLGEIAERCPTCGWRFEREDGYWLGAMAVSITTVVVVFAVFFLGGLALTWPDVPWTGLLVGGLVVNAAIPILGYGWAKTAWAGINLAIHHPEPHEEADAYTATGAAHHEPSGRELDARETGEDGGRANGQ